MTTRRTVQPPDGPELPAALAGAHEAVAELLAGDDRSHAALDVVVWLSAHVAALDRAVYPAVRRTMPDGPALIGQHRALVHRVTSLLRVIERHYSGDTLAAALDGRRLERDLRVLVDEQQAAEHELVARLAGALDASATRELGLRYQQALRHAPTRPHPHLSHAGAFTRLVFWADAVRDRVMDTMDNRHVPVPRAPRRPVRPGRWGFYLLGQRQGGPAAVPRAADRCSVS